MDPAATVTTLFRSFGEAAGKTVKHGTLRQTKRKTTLPRSHSILAPSPQPKLSWQIVFLRKPIIHALFARPAFCLSSINGEWDAEPSRAETTRSRSYTLRVVSLSLSLCVCVSGTRLLSPTTSTSIKFRVAVLTTEGHSFKRIPPPRYNSPLSLLLNKRPVIRIYTMLRGMTVPSSSRNTVLPAVTWNVNRNRP